MIVAGVGCRKGAQAADIAAAIAQALAMPLAERRARHKAMFEVLSRHDIQAWADSFLAALQREPEMPMRLGRV